MTLVKYKQEHIKCIIIFLKKFSLNNFLTLDIQHSSSDQSLSRHFSRSESSVNSKYLRHLGHWDVYNTSLRKRIWRIKKNNLTICFIFTCTIFEVALQDNVTDLKRLIIYELVLCTLLFSINSRIDFIIFTVAKLYSYTLSKWWKNNKCLQNITISNKSMVTWT